MTDGVDKFFAFVRARHGIYELREGGATPPWTADPILAKYRFTNVFRELDRTTTWFRKRVRTPLRDDPRVLPATVIFRWFNRIETGERLIGAQRYAVNLLVNWHPGVARRRLEHVRPVVNGAYIINTRAAPVGLSKLDGIIWCVERFMASDHREVSESMLHGRPWSLEEAWLWLRGFPSMGDFMAYEVVTDLRHTALLERAPDVMTWANPGPGATRGLMRVFGGELNREQATDRKKMNEQMCYLLALSREPGYWPRSWPRWELREVEHSLCEFDKYERARLGEGRPKQLFTPKA